MSRPWMPLYIADYLRDTSHLRAVESGAYLHLIMAYWANGKIPNDDRQLATIAKVSRKEWNKIKPTISQFFGPNWESHKRIDQELARAAEVSEKRREAAQKRRPAANNSSANAEQLQTQSQSQSQPPRNYSALGAAVREQAMAVVSEVQPFLKIDPGFIPPEWFGAEAVVDGWISKGWKPEIIVSSIKAQAARKQSPPQRINYYQNGIADAHAQAEAPLPVGKLHTGRQNGPTENLSQVARRLATEGINFGPRPKSIPDSADGNVVRLLSKG